MGPRPLNIGLSIFAIGYDGRPYMTQITRFRIRLVALVPEWSIWDAKLHWF